MSKPAELSALIRRSSDSTCQRILELLYAFDSLYGEADATTSDGDALLTLSVPSLCLILRYALPGVAPRFLYSLSSNNMLLRSGDRGRSWRSVMHWGKDESATRQQQKGRRRAGGGSMDDSHEVAVAATASSTEAASATTDLAAQMNSIMQLLEDKDDGNNDEELEDTAEAEEEGGPSLSAAVVKLDCSGDVIAVAGRKGFLSMSSDRGMNFSTVDEEKIRAALGTDDKLSHVAVCKGNDDHVVVIFAASAKRVVSLSCRASSKAAAGTATNTSEVTLVMECKTRISLLKVMHLAGQPVLCVADNGVLHMSWDLGRSFVSIPHRMGNICCMDPMHDMRAAKLPSLPKDSKAIHATLSAEGEESNNKNTKRKPQQQQQQPTTAASSSYEYATGCKQTQSCDIGAIRKSFHTSLEDNNVYFRYFFVGGVGTEVLPYDYSCLLCIGLQGTNINNNNNSLAAVFSHGSHVSYVPFTKSAPSERILCASAHAVGSDQAVFARGNVEGVSFSKDLTTWTAPSKAAPVGLAPCDAGAFFVCTQRGLSAMVMGDSAGGAAEASSHTVTGDFRAKTLLDASCV